MQGADGNFDNKEMTKVKRALANSSLDGQLEDSSHSNKAGQGELDAVAWLEEIKIEFNLDKKYLIGQENHQPSLRLDTTL